MNFIGFWKFHSMGTYTDDGLVYLSADEYINSDMSYIDTSDEEAVADEMKERRMTVGTRLKICEDGKAYMLAPVPEGVSDEEVAEAVKEGRVTLMDGMIVAEEGKAWELRDGELWYNTGIEGEVLGEKTDGFIKPIDDEGYFNFLNVRFVKE